MQLQPGIRSEQELKWKTAALQWWLHCAAGQKLRWGYVNWKGKYNVDAKVEMQLQPGTRSKQELKFKTAAHLTALVSVRAQQGKIEDVGKIERNAHQKCRCK